MAKILEDEAGEKREILKVENYNIQSVFNLFVKRGNVV